MESLSKSDVIHFVSETRLLYRISETDVNACAKPRRSRSSLRRRGGLGCPGGLFTLDIRVTLLLKLHIDM